MPFGTSSDLSYQKLKPALRRMVIRQLAACVCGPRMIKSAASALTHEKIHPCTAVGQGSIKKMKIFQRVAGALFVLILAGSGFSQTAATADLHGTVKDPNGAV